MRDRKGHFRLLVLALALGLAASLAGCGSGDDDDNGNPPGGNGDEVWPLKVGNSWNYRLTGSGMPASDLTITATGTQTVGSVTVTKLEYTDSPIGEGYFVLLRNEAAGLFFYGDEFTGPLQTPDLWCKHPCAAGDQWQTSGQGATVQWVVVTASESVTVPAGTFSCIRIRGTAVGGGAGVDHWYCPGTGEVKMQNGTILTLELVSADLN